MRVVTVIATLLLTAACEPEGLLEPPRTNSRPVMEQAASADERPPRASSIIACGRNRISTSPLYVVNGVIVDESTLHALHADLIDSLFVTKSSVAAALYGSRASNGAVHIYTRQTDWRAAR